MSFPVALGLLLALCCSIVGLLGFLFKQRGAVDAPEVQLRHPWRSTKALFSNRWWTLGIVVATGGWVFHVAALALAPISLVQSVIAGGLVLLTPLAGRVFGLPTTRRDWIGVGITAAGLTLLAATLGDSGHSAHRDFDAGDALALRRRPHRRGRRLLRGRRRRCARAPRWRSPPACCGAAAT